LAESAKLGLAVRTAIAARAPSVAAGTKMRLIISILLERRDAIHP
jgi:hypothetical protein